MKQFDQNELTRFLQSLDRHLLQPRDIVLIGGAAASLAYNIARTTTDIDTTHSVADIEEALALARKETGLDVPFQVVGIFDAPYSYEDRLTSLSLGFERLRILVPEKHDLVLMKTVRGQDNDIEAIRQIAKEVGLDRSVLVDRFINDMTHVHGDSRFLRGNFLAVIEALYGESVASELDSELREGLTT